MSRGPARFFLLDPTFAIVFVAACVFGGLLSYFGMVRENYPDLAIPQATIVTEWPGASPEQIEEEITKPLEDEIRALPGLRDYASSSRNGVSIVSVQFQADVDIPFAMQQLRARVDEAEAEFPRGVEAPEIEQVSVNDLPVMTLVLYGDLDAYALNRQAERLQRELERISGIRRANLQGARDRAVHIRLDPARIRSIGLSPVDVRERVTEANRDLAWGSLESETATLPLYLEGRFASVEDVAAVPITRLDDQRLVRLGELGRVFVGLEQFDGETAVSIDGAAFEPSITVAILKRPGADTLATIEEVRRFLTDYTASPDWPAGLEIAELSDEGEIIRDSFSEVVSNLLQGVAAVFAVLVLALTWREATVAALALPITLLAALLAVTLFGFTLNTLVILGMVIALGILVDVFVLVMEGMHEGIYVKGESFDQAALSTVKAYLMPALAGQVTTILAMVPLMAIGGVDGKFIRLIPFTAIACLVASLVIAFTVCIPLSRYLLDRRAAGSAKKTFADRLTERAAGRLQHWLEHTQLQSRARAGLTVGLAACAFVAAILLADTLPSIVYPLEDRRPLAVTIELRPDASYADAGRVAAAAGAYMRSLDYLESVTVHAGERSPFALNTIDEYLLESRAPYLVGVSALFEPKDERDRPTYDYLDEIRTGLEQALIDEPGVVIRLTPDLGGASSADPVQIEVRGDDVERLRDIALAVQDRLSELPGVTDIRDTLGPFRTEVRFVADVEALSFHRLGEDDLLEQVRIAMTADKIGTFQMPGTEPDIDIRLGVDFPSRHGAVGGPREIHELETLAIITETGERVPLFSLVDVSLEPIPTAFIHTDGRRTVTVKARLSGAATATDTAAALRPQLDAMAEDWPAGYSYRFRGEVESAAETYANVGLAFMAAVLLVFAVLTLLLGSFRQPFIIMTMAPLALTGVGFGFFFLQIPISFPAMIGVIALIGIVVNNAIVMVEVINRRLADGMAVAAAAAHGASDRLRPILTTSVTTIVGLTPLALSSPIWYPLCMAIILGLVVATVFALIVVPSLYLLLTPRARSGATREGGMAREPRPATVGRSKTFRAGALPRTVAEMAPLLRLVMPIMAGLAASSIIGVVDTIMISPLGTVPLAAASLTSAAIIIFFAALYGFVAPIGVEAAHRHGAKDTDGVSSALGAGLRLAGGAGMAGALAMAACYLLLPLIGQPADVLAVLAPYWLAMSAFLLQIALLMAVSQVLNAMDRPWTAAIFAFLGVALNVPLNYVLIWGVGSWPGLGLLGAGLASLIAETSALAVALVWLKRSALWRAVRPSRGLKRRLARDGLPLTIGYLGEGAAYALIGIMLGWFGAAALAANQIVQAVVGVLYMIPLAMATAATVRVGQALGGADRDRLRPIAKAALGLVTGWMAIVTVGLVLLGGDISRALSDDEAVVVLGTSMFVAVALIQVADGIQGTALGALRGARDFDWPTVFTLLCYWLFALPLAYGLGFVAGLGPLGLWAGYGLGVVIVAIALPIRFWRLTRLPRPVTPRSRDG